MRVHVSRWCEEHRCRRFAARAAAGEASSSSPGGGTKRSRGEESEDEETGVSEEKGDNTSDDDDVGPPAVVYDLPEAERVPPSTPPAEVGAGEFFLSPCGLLPLPPRDIGESEDIYKLRTKYLALNNSIGQQVAGIPLDQVAKNELFVMKFCMDNGLGRDQGQQLLNWMKSVS